MIEKRQLEQSIKLMQWGVQLQSSHSSSSVEFIDDEYVEDYALSKYEIREEIQPSKNLKKDKGHVSSEFKELFTSSIKCFQE